MMNNNKLKKLLALSLAWLLTVSNVLMWATFAFDTQNFNHFWTTITKNIKWNNWNMWNDWNDWKKAIEKVNLDNFDQMMPTKIKQTLKNMWKIMPTTKISSIKEFKKQLNVVNKRMKLNVVDTSWLNKTAIKQLVNNARQITNIWAWKNFIAVDKWNNIIGFMTLANNFILYPAMLKGNGWTGDIKKVDPNIMAVIENTSKIWNLENKTIETWNDTIRIMKLNKNWYSSTKWLYLQFVDKIGDRIKPWKMTFTFNWNDIALKVYWVYNVNNWQIDYIKN